MIKTKAMRVSLFCAWVSGWTLLAEAPPRACINNMRLIEAAKDQSAIENNLPAGAVIAENEISAYIKNGLESLRCPDKGFYTCGVVDEEPFCSVHGTMDGVMKKGKGLGTRELWGREPRTEGETAMDEIVQAMSRDQAAFDAAILKSKGMEGMRELAVRLFSQSAALEGADLSRKEFDQWFKKLGSEMFNEREEAERRLSQGGALYRKEIASAAQSSDPEVKNRAISILNTWDAGNRIMVRVDYTQYLEAFKVYVTDIEDVALLWELQLRAKGAQDAGAINDGQKQLIDVCLSAAVK